VDTDRLQWNCNQQKRPQIISIAADCQEILCTRGQRSVDELAD
jgi:hypothetical protein